MDNLSLFEKLSPLKMGKNMFFLKFFEIKQKNNSKMNTLYDGFYLRHFKVHMKYNVLY